MKILVIKASTDTTVQRLFGELDKIENKEMECLIQHSQFDRYQKMYPYINFVDIRKERFENLPICVINKISKKRYDKLFVTLTGVHVYHFWNVMELVNRIHFRQAFFYNCNGEKLQIPKKRILKDLLCKAYINWIIFIDRLRAD